MYSLAYGVLYHYGIPMVKNHHKLIWERLLAEHAPRKIDYASLISVAMDTADQKGSMR